jgi:N-acetylglucosamine kinase-like BadF-type ATPase
MIRLYLGIDGGQSSTTALIADESGRILGRGLGGPCNHVAAEERRKKFLTTIGGCIAQACERPGIDPASVVFAAASFGFSGGVEDKEPYLRELVRSEKYKFTHDAEIALTGATGATGPGIIIIAGTGSIAFGRNGSGFNARAGGWGYIFGDEGGAFDLARRALRAALQEEEGWGPPTALRSLLLEATQAPNANTLMHRFYNDFSHAYIASLAPLVTQAAQAGDQPALEIAEQASRKLAWYVAGVYRRLFPAGDRVPVAYIGGAFRSRPLRRAFTCAVKESIGCNVAPPRYGPAEGAILEALRLDGNISDLPKF